MDEPSVSNIAEKQSEQHKLVHDLRNVLSPMLLYAQFLEASLSKLSLESEAHMASMIIESVNDMDAMIVDRLTIK